MGMRGAGEACVVWCELCRRQTHGPNTLLYMSVDHRCRLGSSPVLPSMPPTRHMSMHVM